MKRKLGEHRVIRRVRGVDAPGSMAGSMGKVEAGCMAADLKLVQANDLPVLDVD